MLTIIDYFRAECNRPETHPGVDQQEEKPIVTLHAIDVCIGPIRVYPTLLEAHRMNYILVCKPDSHATLYEEIELLEKINADFDHQSPQGLSDFSDVRHNGNAACGCGIDNA